MNDDRKSFEGFERLGKVFAAYLRLYHGAQGFKAGRRRF